MSGERTAAEEACLYVMGRIVRDPQLCYLMGPGSEAYHLLTEVVGEIRGEGGEAYRALIEQTITCEQVVPRSMYDSLESQLDELRAQVSA